MHKDDQPHSSRYSVRGIENEYMDEKQTVLKNKKGIADPHSLFVEEEKSLAKAYGHHQQAWRDMATTGFPR